jgi:hypothetical protein
MANTRFGNFSELSQGKEPMTAEEAWIMLNQLGLLGQEFVPGATSVRKLMEGKPKEAVEELQDWIPGNAAYQNFIRGKEQDWVRNALDAMIIAKPFARGAKKAVEAIEKMPKGGKEGFIRNPNYIKPMSKAQREATDQAIKEWNKQVKTNAQMYKPSPLKLPPEANYEQERLNKINDFISNQYKFTPKISDVMGFPKYNENIVTQAIMPETVNDAAFLRHNPRMSNYDQVLKATNENIVKDLKAGKIKAGEPYSKKISNPRYVDRYLIEYQTKDGEYAGTSDRAKRDMLLKLEELFPGYIKAMQGEL